MVESRTVVHTALDVLFAPENPTSVNSPRISSLSAASPRTSMDPPGASAGSSSVNSELVTRLAGSRTATSLYWPADSDVADRGTTILSAICPALE